MRQVYYAKEPFELKLFILQCLRKIKWILVGMVVGAVCIGGIYYLKNVTFGGRIPYVITQKYDVDYMVEPSEIEQYSFYTAYTWNDWIKSDLFLEAVPGELLSDMEKEELTGYYEADLPSDLEIPYIIITHPEADTAAEIAGGLAKAMAVFAETNEEIKSIKLMDTIGPELEVRDIRTFRAVVLGAVIGTFFALFAVAFETAVDGSVFLPETISCRYQIPAVGYLDMDGKPSEEVKAGLEYLFVDAKQIGITAVEPELDLTAAKALFAAEKEIICIPSVLQVPESVNVLRNMQANLLLIQADNRNGKAIEAVLHLCNTHDIRLTGALLVGADRGLIRAYHFNERGMSLFRKLSARMWKKGGNQA